MGYDWKGNAEREGTAQAEKLPDGVHYVEITRVIFTDKDGVALSSKSGDAKIGIIFADNEGREGAEWVTLSDKAAFVLARILSKAGVDLEKMATDGKVPSDFAEPQFAEPNLIGRTLRVEITTNKKGNMEVVPLDKDAAAPTPPVDAGEIPF